MLDFILTILCVVGILYVFVSSGRRERPLVGMNYLKSIGVAFVVFMIALLMAFVLSEQIAVYHLSSNGYDVVGAFVKNYGVMAVLLLYWGALWLLGRLNHKGAILGLHSSVVLLFVVIFFVVRVPPYCEGEGMVCLVPNLRAAGVLVVVLFALFLLLDIVGLVKARVVRRRS